MTQVLYPGGGAIDGGEYRLCGDDGRAQNAHRIESHRLSETTPARALVAPRPPWHPSAVRPAPMRPASIMAFVVAFLALSVIADKSAMFVGLSLVGWERPRSVTGTVTEWHAGDTIAVGSEQNPRGFPLALRPNTVYEGDAGTIRVGVRATVWYRNVSERRLVVEKLRVLDRVVPR